MKDHDNHDTGPPGSLKRLGPIRAVDSPRTISPRPDGNKPAARGIDREFLAQLRQVRHQWTAILMFDNDMEEHHRFAEADDLELFLRRNRRYTVKRTFQTVIHPRHSFAGPPDHDPVAA